MSLATREESQALSLFSSSNLFKIHLLKGLDIADHLELCCLQAQSVGPIDMYPSVLMANIQVRLFFA